MNLLKKNQAQSSAEVQEHKRKKELAEVEALLLQKKQEIVELGEVRLSQKDSFAREMESCFQLLDETRGAISELEVQKRELLKPVDGLLDEAYQLHTEAQAQVKRSEELFETAEVRLVEGKQVMIASRKLAESLVVIVDSIGDIMDMPTKEILSALGVLRIHSKNTLTFTKDIKEASKDVISNVKLASTTVQKERENLEAREAEMKKEKRHIASQQASIRAAIGK